MLCFSFPWMTGCHVERPRSGESGINTQSNDKLKTAPFLISLVVDVMKQIDIPSVFVSEETANSLKEEYIYDKG